MFVKQTTFPIDGRTWALEEIKYPSISEPAPTQTSGIGSRTDAPAVVTQHAVPPRKFVVLSADGIHILLKQRPVEQLRHLMIECGGPDSEQVKSFFRLHKVE